MSDSEPRETPESFSAEGDAILQECPGCGTMLDVSGEELFSQVHCPMCGMQLNARTQLKNFTLQERVGGGGMGTVYKALDRNLDRLVALKVVRKEYSSDAEYVEKFETEARITASVNHPHVVKVFSFGSDRGLFYIAMELVDKGSLDDLMGLQGRVAEAQVLEVGIQIAEGLRAAHLNGLIHRDVKPGNILFADAHTAKIVDFGLALLVEHAAEERGEVWGTPYYVAPEKLNHEPEDFRSDMYSLGATLFHAVAGRPPFEAQTASLVALKHIKSKAVSLQAFAPDVSSATAFVINRMMQKEPSERYQSYDELIEHLTYARTELLAAAGAPRQKERVVMEGKQQQAAMTWITLGLFGILVAAGVLLFVFRDKFLKKGDDTIAERHETDAPTQYQNARRQLLAGDNSGAMGSFRQLGDQTGVAQPLADWASFHEGLCAFLDGRLPSARAAFQKIGDRGLYSADPNEKALAGFFIETAKAVLDDKEFPPERAKSFDSTSYQSIALLVLGLKNWETQKFDAAAPLLKQFLSSHPQPPFDWIADYKPFAQHYADDYETCKKVSDKIQAAQTPEDRAAALKTVQDLRGGHPMHGKINDYIADLERAAQKKISEASLAETKLVVEQRERDAKAFEAARAKYAAANAQYDFDAARKIIESTPAGDGPLATERATLLKKSEWIADFKKLLVREVNVTGYPDPLVKKGGFRLVGGVHKANATQVEIVSQYGSVPVLWKDLMPATLLAMGTHFAKTAPSPDQAADRMWLTGVFAIELGMDKEGRALIVQASQSKAEYQEQLKLFFQ